MAAALTALVLVLLAVGLIGAYTLRTGISPVPTTPAVVASMLEAIPAERLTAIEVGTIFELGSGWGTLALALARRFPRARVLGYELSPLPWLVSRLLLLLFVRPNLSLRRADFLGVPLHEASLVVCYLYPGGMARLRPKLEAELAPGSVIVSNTFALPDWPAERTFRAPDLYDSPIYVYVAPPKPAVPAAAPRRRLEDPPP